MTDLTSNALPRPGLADRLRPWLSGRRGLIVAAAAMVGGGLWAGWPWLAAAGIAPILLSLAPCAAMCAVGICTMKACGKPAGTTADTAPVSPARPGEAAPQSQGASPND